MFTLAANKLAKYAIASMYARSRVSVNVNQAQVGTHIIQFQSNAVMRCFLFIETNPHPKIVFVGNLNVVCRG